MRRSTLLRRSLAALALVAGCTAVNPDYEGPFGGDGSATAFDGSVDLARRPPDLWMRPPDLAGGGGACTPGQRGCSTTGAGAVSMRCDNSKLVVDRACPFASLCQAGYCQVPPTSPDTTQGIRCNSESQCYVSQATSFISCQPFVLGQRVDFHCAQKLGEGASGVPCKRGSDCRSGYCIPGVGTCFRLCSGGNADCPNYNGRQTQCRPVKIVVEGVETEATSCVLP